MKKALTIFLLFLILPLLATAQMKAPYDGTISVGFTAPVVRGGEATFRADVDMARLKLPPAVILEFTLVVRSSSAARQIEFAPVVVANRQLAKVVARDGLLGQSPREVQPMEILELKRNNRLAHLVVTTPYEQWMRDAEVVLIERSLTYGDSGERYGDYSQAFSSGPYDNPNLPLTQPDRVSEPVIQPRSTSSNIVTVPVRTGQTFASAPQVSATTRVEAEPDRSPETYKPQFRISYQSASAAVRTYSESFSGHLSFAQNNSLINRTIADNAVILAEVDARLRAIQSDPLLTVNTITITGYASPEGEIEGNRNLADHRVQTFVNYLANVHNLRSPGVKVITAAKGEDWNGLRKMVENSTMDDRYRILDALDNYTEVGQRRAALQELNSGNTYAVLLNYFSALRRVEYTIEYGSPSSGPDQAVYSEAAADLERGAYDAAIGRLSRLETPQAWNNLGIAYWHKGDYDRSLACFQRAANAGWDVAALNLSEYRKWAGFRNE